MSSTLLEPPPVTIEPLAEAQPHVRRGTPKRTVTLMPGEGAGPEVIAAARRVLDAAGARIEWEEVDAGEAARARGVLSGLPWEAVDSLRRTGVVLKGPMSLPGHGLGSTDHLLRRAFEAYASVCRIRALEGAPTPFGHRQIRMLLVRNNLPDLDIELDRFLWSGQDPVPGPMSCPFDEKTIRLAFDLATLEGFESVHCAIRSGQRDVAGLQRAFYGAAADHPGIAGHCIDQYLLAQELVVAPEMFGVVVTGSARDDLISDLATRLVGGVALVPTASLGAEAAMFEPMHGSAAALAGKDVVNPIGAIRAGALLLRFLGQDEAAARVDAALGATLRRGIGTADLRSATTVVGTRAFADAVVARLEKELWSEALTALTPLSPSRLRGAAALGAHDTSQTILASRRN